MRKKAKSATPNYLESVALWYLQRYGGSEKAVRRTLNKRIKRAVEELGEDRQRARDHLETVIAKLKRLGYINDLRLTTALVAKLRRRGLSQRKIIANLQRRGIDRQLIEEQLQAHDSDGAAEWQAAQVFARKRRIGPYRRQTASVEDKQRELGKMARAGFSFDVCRRVLDSVLADDESSHSF